MFRATFSEDVTNVDTGDFAANGTTATVTAVTPVSSTVYDVTVSGGDLAGLNGTVGLDLAAGQNITDTANNRLPAGEPATDEDYLVDNTATISDFVFDDSNGDGLQTGESGRDGVTVNLLDSGGIPTGQSTVTAGGGFYSFVVSAGTYIVEFVAPAGTTFSLQDVGGDDTIDSDVNPTGRTAPITVVAGQTNDTIDAGLIIITPPQVVDVLVNGAAWSGPFLQEIDPGRGLGFSIPAGAPDQLLNTPWVNVDQIRIEFDQDVTVTQSDLKLVGVNMPLYTFLADDPTDTVDPNLDGFRYDGSTMTATWTLDASLGNDKLLIVLSDSVNAGGTALDGETGDPANATLPSGDGTPGGNFLLRFNSLPGNTLRNGVASIDDIAPLRDALGSFIVNANYNLFADYNGDGTVSIDDIAPLRDHLGQKLPLGEPSPPMPAPAPLALFAQASPEPIDSEPKQTNRVKLASYHPIRARKIGSLKSLRKSHRLLAAHLAVLDRLDLSVMDKTVETNR